LFSTVRAMFGTVGAMLCTVRAVLGTVKAVYDSKLSTRGSWRSLIRRGPRRWLLLMLTYSRDS
jgi:hypothetical protein